MTKRKVLDGDTELILAILVGGTAYAHRKVLDMTINYTILSVLALSTSLLIYLLLRYIFKAIYRKQPSNISMEDIDKMSGKN